MTKDFEEYISKVLANRDVFAGYSADNKLLILSTDINIVTDTVREYNKRHNVETAFGYPTFRTYGKAGDILVRNMTNASVQRESR